jgi:hypothetical protein
MNAGVARGVGGRCAGRAVLLGAVTVVAALSAGCETLKSCCGQGKPPVGVPCKLAATWEPCVMEAPDPLHGGAPLRGLAGRVYMCPFDSDVMVATEDGSVIVDLYDDRPVAAGGQPVPLERWQFPKEVLAKLLRKDIVGWGYTLFLPWLNSYKPDISLVHLRVCYVPSQGAPLYASSSPMRLHSDVPQVHYSQSTEAPGKAVQPAAARPPAGQAGAPAPQPFVQAVPAPLAPHGILQPAGGEAPAGSARLGWSGTP